MFNSNPFDEKSKIMSNQTGMNSGNTSNAMNTNDSNPFANICVPGNDKMDIDWIHPYCDDPTLSRLKTPFNFGTNVASNQVPFLAPPHSLNDFHCKPLIKMLNDTPVIFLLSLCIYYVVTYMLELIRGIRR